MSLLTKNIMRLLSQVSSAQWQPQVYPAEPLNPPAGAAALWSEILFVRLISPSFHIHPVNIIAPSSRLVIMSSDNVINVHTIWLASSVRWARSLFVFSWMGWFTCRSLSTLSPFDHVISISWSSCWSSALKKGRSFRGPPKPPLQRSMMFQCCWNV